MKKLFLFFMFIYLAGNAMAPVYAQTASGSAKPTEADKLKAIEDLKDRLATKVAELRNLQQKAITGKVKSQTVSSITIETKTKDIKIELPDSVKVVQYIKNAKTKLTTDDIDNGDNIVVFGDYDATIDILKSKVILIDNTPPKVHISGVITKIDEEEFTLNVKTSEAIEYLVDIEKTTKTSELANGSLAKSGFSKFKIGNTVQVIGTAEPKKEKQLSALRIIDLGRLMPFTEPTATPSPELTATPTGKTAGKPTPSTKP